MPKKHHGYQRTKRFFWSQLMLSGISLPQILIIALIIILLFGTSKLKNLGKDLGGAIKGFKQSMKEEDDASSADKKQNLTHEKRIDMSEEKSKSSTHQD